jgi:porin
LRVDGTPILPAPPAALVPGRATSSTGSQVPGEPAEPINSPATVLDASTAAAMEGSEASNGSQSNSRFVSSSTSDSNSSSSSGSNQNSIGSLPTSSNPAAVNIKVGTGALGRLLGFDDDSGVFFGGLWTGAADGILSGGFEPGKWGLNSLTISNIILDNDKLVGWKGNSFGIAFLQFSGQDSNGFAGANPGFNGLPGAPPLVREQLYQLWVRQAFFDDKLVFRIGKTVPTFDFNNVVKPVPVGDDPSAAIPAVTGLIYTPIFVNPTMQGVLPGYYNSACGITTTLAPTNTLYMNYGFYDGNGARGVQTGMQGPHFNGYYFHIGEIGRSWRIGPQHKPGNFGVGVWGQTGELKKSTGTGLTPGANGTYLFGAQRLWFRHYGVDNSGISGFYQFGANNKNIMAVPAREYVGGGFTAFGLVPGRPDDSFGLGVNCAWLAPPLRSSQLMTQFYYQMKLRDGLFFQPTLTDIPTPGKNASIPNALAITLQIIALF